LISISLATAARDPIEFPRSYLQPEDKEISGFIASAFAYGNVNLFKPVVRTLLSKMGESPYAFIRQFNIKRQRKLLQASNIVSTRTTTS